MSNLNTMDESILTRIKDLISRNETIGIAIGRNHSLDDMAAALSVYLTLSKMNKKVSIASPLDPVVGISNLVGINKVKKNFDGQGGDLVVSFPYQEGEIEKVSYTLDAGYLNIIVKAGEKGISFEDRDIAYKRGGQGLPSLVFVIGTPRLSDLGNIFDTEGLKNSTLINIDNKNDNQGFGDVLYVSSKFSSVSEQAADLISYLTPNIDIDVAQNLLDGISYATENFQKSTTSSTAFELAGILMRSGAVRASLTKTPKAFNDDPFFAPKAQQQTTPSSQRVSQTPFSQQSNQGFTPKRDQFQRDETETSQFQNFPKQNQRDESRDFSQNLTQPNQGTDFSFNQPKREPEEKEDKNPPSDWLTPKIYKGSTNI